MAFRIDPAAPLRLEFARIVEETAGAIDGHLRIEAGDHVKALHEARKAIKKLRALLRLARAAAPEPLRQEERRLRDAARAIAGPREAGAAVETLDRFIAAFPKRIVECRLGEIRAALLARCDRVAGDGLDAASAKARGLCGEARTGLRAVAFDPALSDADILRAGMEKTLSHWEKALDAARRHGRPADFHELRKTVKAHWAQLGLLRGFGDGFGKRREAVEALGERLGELNDIHVMREALASGALGLPEALDTRPFDRLLKKQGKALAGKALDEAERLLVDRPRKLRRRLHGAAAQAA